MQNKNGYKRAFTLTELLVVVVIIGVLAAVVLPKFSKVLETRKTTEAENILRAVRTEQERRCALDKNYLGNLNKMPDLVPNTTTANYTYAALTGGIRAQSNGSLSYQLQMPSYADGRICCTGTDCSQLNKDYPTCDELRAKPDYVASPDECAADVGETPDPAQCGPQPADDQESCPSGFCGTRTRSYTCNHSTGQWIPGPWQEACAPKQTEEITQKQPCPGSQGMMGHGPASAYKTRTCTVTYNCDGSEESRECGEWDTSACAETGNYGWVQVYGGGATGCPDYTGAEGLIPPWGRSWACEHCGNTSHLGACNADTVDTFSGVWWCENNGALFYRRWCSLVKCVENPEEYVNTDHMYTWHVGIDTSQPSYCD